MSIEKITAATLPEVREVGEKFTASVNYPGGFDYPSFAEAWGPTLQLGLGEIYAARNSDRHIVGLFGAYFSKDPFSGWKTAAEAFWFVLPEYRRSSIAMRLFDRFEQEAKERACKKILMIHLDGEFGEVLEKLYTHRGYKVIEKTFCKLI